MSQCSCCGKRDVVFGNCRNCGACGPEGANHSWDEEVYSDDRLADAIRDLSYALSTISRILKQRSSDERDAGEARP